MASTQISVTPQKQKKRATLIPTSSVPESPVNPAFQTAAPKKSITNSAEDLNKLITVKECNERMDKFLKENARPLSEGQEGYMNALKDIIDRYGNDDEEDAVLDFDNLTDDEDEEESEDDGEDEDEYDDDEDKVRENERRLKKQKAVKNQNKDTKKTKVQGPCNNGQIRDRKSGECRDKVKKSPKCSPGQVFDRKSKQCRDKMERKKRPKCSPGQVFDRKSKQCRAPMERKKATPSSSSSSSTFPMADPLVKITGTKDPNMLKMYADYLKANKEVVEAQPMPTTPRKRSSPKKTAPKSPPPKSPTKRTSPKKGTVRAPKKIFPIVYNPQAIDAAPSGVPMEYAYKPR